MPAFPYSLISGSALVEVVWYFIYCAILVIVGGVGVMKCIFKSHFLSGLVGSNHTFQQECSGFDYQVESADLSSVVFACFLLSVWVSSGALDSSHSPKNWFELHEQRNYLTECNRTFCILGSFMEDIIYFIEMKSKHGLV